MTLQSLTILARNGGLYILRTDLATAEKVAELTAAGGQFTFVLRPDVDDRVATTAGSTIDTLIDEFGFPVPKPPVFEDAARSADQADSTTAPMTPVLRGPAFRFPDLASEGRSHDLRIRLVHLAAGLGHRRRAVDDHVGGGHLLLLRRLVGEPGARLHLAHAARRRHPGDGVGLVAAHHPGAVAAVVQRRLEQLDRLDAGGLDARRLQLRQPGAVSLRTSGCRMASRSRSAAGSLNTIGASLPASIVPKRASIRRRASASLLRIWRATASRSITATPISRSQPATVHLPQPMLPVSPITFMPRPGAPSASGAFWQRGQKCVLRCPTTIRSIARPQRKQGSPVRR